MRPSFGISLIPVIVLIGMLTLSVQIFGDEMLSGPSQIVLVLATAIAAGLGMLRYGKSWEELEDAMVKSISRTMPANLILLLVGSLCGTWMHAGIIPTMIYYGLDVISARWLLLTASVICSMVSLCIGSSWTTIATVGVGLIGIGRTLGIEDAWVAGAIISGAYFGDKISPLSETTNLASSTAGVPLFEHIRNMLQTTVPSLIVTLVVFLCMGLFSGNIDDSNAAQAAIEMQTHLDETFAITPLLLMVPLLIFYLIYRGIPATIVLTIGTAIAAVIIGVQHGFEFALRAIYGEVGYETGFEPVDALTATRGMGGMLNTIWLILMAMCFGGVMESTGMLNALTHRLLRVMKGRFRTVTATCLSSLFLNVTTGDQCLAIILPAKMYGEAYRHQGLPSKLLSRSLEDGGTVTSVLIPWNSCGMTQAAVLGVATIAYAPFAIFCWISPLMSMFFAAIQGRKGEVQ